MKNKILNILLWLLMCMLVELACSKFFLALDAKIARLAVLTLFSAACGSLLSSIITGIFKISLKK